MATDSKISLLITVHNEETYLPKLHDGLEHELKKRDASYQFVYVDNGSTDGSLDVLRKLHDHDPEHVAVVTMRSRFDRAMVLSAGLPRCEGSTLVGLPATGEVPPSSLDRLLKDFEEGVDFLMGWQPNRSVGVSRHPATWLHSQVLSRCCGVRIRDMYCEAFVANKELLSALLPVPEGMELFLPLLAHRRGYQVVETQIPCNDFIDEDASFVGGLFGGLFDFLRVIRAGAWLFGPLRAFAVVAVCLFGLAVPLAIGALILYLQLGFGESGATACLCLTSVILGLSITAMIAGTAAESAMRGGRVTAADLTSD